MCKRAYRTSTAVLRTDLHFIIHPFAHPPHHVCRRNFLHGVRFWGETSGVRFHVWNRASCSGIFPHCGARPVRYDTTRGAHPKQNSQVTAFRFRETWISMGREQRPRKCEEERKPKKPKERLRCHPIRMSSSSPLLPGGSPLGTERARFRALRSSLCEAISLYSPAALSTSFRFVVRNERVSFCSSFQSTL